MNFPSFGSSYEAKRSRRRSTKEQKFFGPFSLPSISLPIIPLPLQPPHLIIYMSHKKVFIMHPTTFLPLYFADVVDCNFGSSAQPPLHSNNEERLCSGLSYPLDHWIILLNTSFMHSVSCTREKKAQVRTSPFSWPQQGSQRKKPPP